MQREALPGHRGGRSSGDADVDVRGTRLAYRLSGTGDEVVVLAAGSGMPPVVWELCRLVDALERAGYRVLRYAARGVAPSDAPDGPYAIGDFAEDILGLLEALDITACHVVGYSIGGFAAELLARTRPDVVRSAVLLASAGPLSPVLRTLLEVADEFMATSGTIPPAFSRWQDLMTALPPSMLHDDTEVATWWELAELHERCWTSPAGKIGHWTAAASWMRDNDRLALLREISIPVVVACFEHDLLFPPDGGRAAAAAIRGGTFTHIPGAAHSGLVTHSDRCVGLILDALSRQ